MIPSKGGTIAHTPRALLLLVSMASFDTSGCCPSATGRVRDQWVLVARDAPAAGVARAPRYGAPLEVRATQDVSAGCFSSAALDAHFGEQCADHETEGGASDHMGSALPVGPHPTPGEVRWYCDRHTVLRVVLARCAAENTFRATEIAVARPR